MDGAKIHDAQAAQAQLGESLVRQLLASSGISKAFSSGSPMHEGMFLEALSTAVAQQTPLIPAPPAAGNAKATSQDVAAQVVEQGQLSSGFGPRVHPITHAQVHHDGLDVAAQLGAPVHCVRPGVVALARAAQGYGNMVVVRHASGAESRYAHLDNMFVTPGQILKAGEVVGQVGSTGATTGPHVHFEWRDNGVVVDPTLALNKTAAVPNYRLPALASAALRRAP